MKRTVPFGAALLATAIAASGALAGCSTAVTGDARASDAPVDCHYDRAGEAARPNKPPHPGAVPGSGLVHIDLDTSAGAIPLTLDRSRAPCTVHSFLSLARQSYFNDTACHRLTGAPAAIFVLQCGDPSGTGTGGPGYVVPDEPPAGLRPNPHGTGVIYPRGAVALANLGVPDSGGSQFFLVYRDSPLPPAYAVFGTVDAPGLPVLDRIARGGQDGSRGPGDGRPRLPVDIRAVDVPFG